jgi:hypothetical protein
MFFKKRPDEIPADRGEILHCSFCNKTQRQVKKLIAGPNVLICDECVDICLAILNDPGEVDESYYTRDDDGAIALAVRCRMCNTDTLTSRSLLVAGRGILCAGCIDAIEAALDSVKG